jgi:hypothetical protein
MVKRNPPGCQSNVAQPLALDARARCGYGFGQQLASHLQIARGHCLRRSLAAPWSLSSPYAGRCNISSLRGGRRSSLNAESRSALDERALIGSRLKFGWHFPFRVAQPRDARERGGKLSRYVNVMQPDKHASITAARPIRHALSTRRIDV